MLLASIALDREPLQWAQLPQALLLWAQNCGGIAALGLILWMLARALQREPMLVLSPTVSASQRSLLTNFFVVAAAFAIAGYALVIVLWLGRILGFSGGENWFPRSKPDDRLTVGDFALMISGVCAVLLVSAPVLWSLCFRIRFGRIWALARLSIMEAVRGRIVWVFGAMALVFLFADWFVSYKPENQVRNYVRVVYWSMTPLFLLTAGLLGSFSIPTDVKNYSIHTIVTKPVEKFEIVLGRFLGYAILLTAGLFVVSILSLGYVVRGVNEEAKKESFTARVANYGDLSFEGTKDTKVADSVGREWTYRSYITGPTLQNPNAFRQYGVWKFPQVPTDLGERTEPAQFEFAFDIFRLTKGDEGKGVLCTFTFNDGTVEPLKLDSLVNQRNEEFAKLQTAAQNQFPSKKELDQAREAIKLELAKKYRFHQESREVTDYHTQIVSIPAAIYKELISTAAPARKPGEPKPPMLTVFFNVNTARQTQMVGVAKNDFYLLETERPFWQNFLKGIIGMWCTYMLVLGVAIACSTYLSGVISLLCTLFLYGAGLSTEYLKEIAERQLDGGGPAESLIRITTHMAVANRLEPSPTTSVVRSLDTLFSWWISRFLNLVPNISRHDLHQYVANGFDIGWTSVLLVDNLLPLLGYLIPWAILAYYLMKYREIANPT